MKEQTDAKTALGERKQCDRYMKWEKEESDTNER